MQVLRRPRDNSLQTLRSEPLLRSGQAIDKWVAQRWTQRSGDHRELAPLYCRRAEDAALYHLYKRAAHLEIRPEVGPPPEYGLRERRSEQIRSSQEFRRIRVAIFPARSRLRAAIIACDRFGASSRSRSLSRGSRVRDRCGRAKSRLPRTALRCPARDLFLADRFRSEEIQPA